MFHTTFNMKFHVVLVRERVVFWYSWRGGWCRWRADVTGFLLSSAKGCDAFVFRKEGDSGASAELKCCGSIILVLIGLEFNYRNYSLKLYQDCNSWFRDANLHFYVCLFINVFQNNSTYSRNINNKDSCHKIWFNLLKGEGGTRKLPEFIDSLIL